MEKLLELARELADGLADDIGKARTREEHVRVTARANKAMELVSLLAAGDLTDG